MWRQARSQPARWGGVWTWMGGTPGAPPLGHCPRDVIHIFQGWNKIAKGWNKIAEGWNKIAKGWNKIAEGWNKIAKGWNKIAERWNKIAKGWNKIAKGWNKIAERWNKIAKGWNKIAKGWNKIFGMGNWGGGRTTPPDPPPPPWLRAWTVILIPRFRGPQIFHLLTYFSCMGNSTYTVLGLRCSRSPFR